MSLSRILPRSLPAGREVVIDATVAQARQGDPDAFARLYDAHAPRIHAVCLRLSGDPALATELLQDVFVRAWSGLGGFRGDSSFATWLHRLAVNVVLERARGDSRRHRRVALGDDLGSPTADRAGRIDQPELRLDIERAIADLAPALREVFVLHDLEGFRHDEIGAMIGIPVGTSRSHLFRARRLLREALS